MCCAERASTRKRVGRRRQARALIAGRANTLPLKETMLNPIVYFVGWALTRLILGLNLSFRASTAPQGRFRHLLAMIQRTIVCSAAKASTLCQMEPAQLARAKTAYPESTRPCSGQTQMPHASHAALASTQHQPAIKQKRIVSSVPRVHTLPY